MTGAVQKALTTITLLTKVGPLTQDNFDVISTKGYRGPQ